MDGWSEADSPTRCDGPGCQKLRSGGFPDPVDIFTLCEYIQFLLGKSVWCFPFHNCCPYYLHGWYTTMYSNMFWLRGSTYSDPFPFLCLFWSYVQYTLVWRRWFVCLFGSSPSTELIVYEQERSRKDVTVASSESMSSFVIFLSSISCDHERNWHSKVLASCSPRALCSSCHSVCVVLSQVRHAVLSHAILLYSGQIMISSPPVIHSKFDLLKYQSWTRKW